jgi:hypothetical protein
MDWVNYETMAVGEKKAKHEHLVHCYVPRLHLKNIIFRSAIFDCLLETIDDSREYEGAPDTKFADRNTTRGDATRVSNSNHKLLEEAKCGLRKGKLSLGIYERADQSLYECARAKMRRYRNTEWKVSLDVNGR